MYTTRPAHTDGPLRPLEAQPMLKPERGRGMGTTHGWTILMAKPRWSLHHDWDSSITEACPGRRFPGPDLGAPSPTALEWEVNKHRGPTRLHGPFATASC
jgi:hypothetical protein